ncbi:UNKNOWN [Stylonychia lemnae]|uniref:Uncharacterized protein n=1 Tax=Stylonychia lemnae TaxID=5949 RepID=A0A077ZRE8_STYLE|nr:UNKNOWN [Stylonychia lemnae]|eukprot:CDW71076.1 UNKNOWN [Stylonychia lemnae]
MVSSGCEGLMGDAFLNSMDKLRDQKYQLALINERHHRISLELVDFHHYFGASISRKQNRKDMIKVFSPLMLDLPNMTMYTKGNTLESLQSLLGFQKQDKSNIKISGINLQLVVKFKTNYKLNLISKEGNKLISNDQAIDEEIHFVKFEGQYPEFELNAQNLRKSLEDFNFQDWSIVDFDDFLKGNPHI